MKAQMVVTAVLLASGAGVMACRQAKGAAAATPSRMDAALTAFIEKIRAVDNHTHANSVAPNDSDSDALPLEALLPFEIAARLRPENPDWLGAARALYGYPHPDFSDSHLPELRGAVKRVAREQGDKFPEWTLDRIGTEVMLANRVAMGPGLVPPRFRWVSYVDALMLPLSTTAEAATSPDRQRLYPFEDKLLQRYLAELHVERLPSTLDAYLKTIVTPTLEAQRKGGCVALKFEAGFLRSLDFEDAPARTASAVYSRYVAGGEPSHADYKAVQDFLFRYIAREAGRLGMAVHIHSFNGPGNFYHVTGSDPLLLEPVLNDPTLRQTSFVIVHAGGAHAARAGALLWKPNVYRDLSALTLIHTPARLAEVMREWLLQYPEKVLFGTDAAAFGPDLGWELSAWIGTTTARQALAVALTEMLRNGEASRARVEEIATMVLRTNAGKLYGLKLQ
jgi:uncharacterized protein